AATLASFNIPEAGLLLIIGIDQFLDMGRSATNVIGNTLATAVVAKWEGEKGDPREAIVVIDPAAAWCARALAALRLRRAWRWQCCLLFPPSARRARTSECSPAR